MGKKHIIRLAGLATLALMASATAWAVSPTDSGTFYVAKGIKTVNETVVRSGKDNTGQMEFTGYATFDLSGIPATQLQSSAFSLNCNLKVFSGKPVALTIDYLGTFSNGDLNPTTGAAWSTSAAATCLSTGPTPKGRIVTGALALPDTSLSNRFAVFRFKNPVRGVQWDITAPVLTITDGGTEAPRTDMQIRPADISSGAGELYRKMIPAEKQLDADWLASLTERGHPLDAAIRGSKADDSLKYIGMPVGGIACGTLVMDGAGQLYSWDIFAGRSQGIVKQNIPLPDGYEGFKDGKYDYVRPLDGANYMNPPTVQKFPPPLKQGFALRFADGSERTFGEKDWASVQFEGRWPMGMVSYDDPKSPVSATLTAYSPFIPLDVENSKLPATVMSYRLENKSSQSVSVELMGWLGRPAFTSIQPVDAIFESSQQATTLIQPAIQTPKNGKTNGTTGSMTLSFQGAAKQIDMTGTPGLTILLTLTPGESREFPFLISWHFGHHAYTPRFSDAQAVSSYVWKHFSALSSETRQWVKTWNDSTLPQWFLDRAMAPASTLQTANCQFAGERFWAWEGIGAGMGTCTHVWGYAQAMARLFPSLERNLREVTDFGKKQLKDGSVPFRFTHNNIAIDGQCGTVLRSYREHLVSVDSEFLKRNWPNIKRALNYLIEFDKHDDAFDGLLDGEQHNTLDAEWYGKVHVLCSLYLASLRAGEEMAMDVGDAEYQTLCRETFEMGSRNIEKLYNGEYYVQLEDPNHSDAIGVGPGVYIDQVYGQFWADQVGLGPLYNPQHIRSALNSVWKYNYLTDVGPFREVFRPGRFYAWKGDGGVLMCTWPNGGIRDDYSKHWQYGYFNECMSGFEHQLAAHMIGSDDPDLLSKGLAVMRTVHDRYAPGKRNPYNEVEFSDFYARAMASYGSFIAACGFEYNGPEQMIGFSPVIQPEDFRAPFTAAEGWGTYSQTLGKGEMSAELRLTWGKVSVKTLRLSPRGFKPTQVEVTCDGKQLDAELVSSNGIVSVELAATIEISKDEVLRATLK